MEQSNPETFVKPKDWEFIDPVYVETEDKQEVVIGVRSGVMDIIVFKQDGSMLGKEHIYSIKFSIFKETIFSKILFENEAAAYAFMAILMTDMTAMSHSLTEAMLQMGEQAAMLTSGDAKRLSA